jgi:PTS system galactitol-specific IIC component
MEIIDAIVQFVMDIGGGAFLPIIITVMGVVFRLGFFDSLRNGLRVGAGFLGINIVLNMLVNGIKPVVDYYSGLGTGSGFTVVDIGWEGMSAVAWSTSFALLIVPLGMLLNYILLKIRFTKTMDIDVWNYFHVIIGGSMLYYILTLAGVTQGIAYVLSILFALVTFVIVLKWADWIAPLWQKYYDLPGTTCCNNDTIYLWGINMVICKIIDKIPGLNKVSVNVSWFSEKLGSLGESSVLTFIVGILLSIITQQSPSNTLYVSVTLAAAVILMPKVVSLLMEGLSPVSRAASTYFKNRLGNEYDIYIGMDEALCLGDETGIELVGIMIPITMLIAFLPGISMFPISTLGSLIYITCAASLFANGDVFRNLVSSIAIVIYKSYINSWMAPVATMLAFQAGYITNTTTLVSGSTTAEFNCVLVGLFGKLLQVW